MSLPSDIDAPLATRTAEYRVFQALGENCGVVVIDPESGACVMRFRRDWHKFAGDEADVLRALAEDLPTKQHEMGTQAFLRWIDENLSNTLSVEPPAQSMCIDLQRTAQALYHHHVHSEPLPFQTHLPLIPIDLAAGGLGQDRAAGATEWIDAEVPGRHGLSKDLFLVRIHGRSMEPDIPDGSICVFRPYQGGSRKGGIFIVQRRTSTDDGGEFTIKRYESSKNETADGWSHSGIHMQPDNPEFSSWDLTQEEDRWVTVAQFICVLEDPI
ncbi:S24 family peptidase [uncultured Paludibaculum sp.]|uniref:S24 family peptidase n=1 Tax=uncultured Paludibaculum sp. TaxID=1765020 RepID=UPI002AABB0C1|nr:S24 family peptidase [uncultured Paludibaculum sp.]